MSSRQGRDEPAARPCDDVPSTSGRSPSCSSGRCDRAPAGPRISRMRCCRIPMHLRQTCRRRENRSRAGLRQTCFFGRQRRRVDVSIFLCCLCQHPAGKICRFRQGDENCFRAGENIFDLHVCTHGRRVGAEQLYVSRRAKAAQTVMVLGS
jgi:hypothetical protein